MQKFLKGGVLSVDRGKSTPIVEKPIIFAIMLYLDGSEKSVKNLLLLSGGQQMHFECMTKISNYLMTLGVLFQNLAAAYLTDLKPYCKVFS